MENLILLICQKLMGILAYKFGWILLLNGSLHGSATTFYALLNKKSLVQTHICKKTELTHSPPQQRLSELQALQSQVSDADGFSIFSVLRNPDAQGHIIPQYEGINLFYMLQMKKAITMYGPHSPFTKELLNAVASSIGNFILYNWRVLIKALLKPGEYLQWTMWFTT